MVFGGAVLSLWRVVGGRERTRGRGLAAHPKRLAVGNALIAVGTLILGASGPLNGRLGASKAFAVTLTIGVTVLFAGFLVATSSPRRPETDGGAARSLVSVSGAPDGGPSLPSPWVARRRTSPSSGTCTGRASAGSAR